MSINSTAYPDLTVMIIVCPWEQKIIKLTNWATVIVQFYNINIISVSSPSLLLYSDKKNRQFVEGYFPNTEFLWLQWLSIFFINQNISCHRISWFDGVLSIKKKEKSTIYQLPLFNFKILNCNKNLLFSSLPSKISEIICHILTMHEQI